MDRVATISAVLATLALGQVFVWPNRRPGLVRRWWRRRIEREQLRLQQARINANPKSSVWLSLLAPVALFGLGWVVSPPVAIALALSGLLAPRLYLAWLVDAHRRRSEAEAPHLVQVLIAELTAGSTYLDSLRHARAVIEDPWIVQDLDHVIHLFMLDVPLESGIREIRSRVHGRNLGLTWDALITCAANRIPTPTARVLLGELAESIQFNVQLQNEARSRASGQRLQIWILALLVPGMYLYMRLLSPGLLDMLDDTLVGRYFLLPVAVGLEALGIFLSLRLVRVTS
jgi:Flp pilus assembly protein TadB